MVASHYSNVVDPYKFKEILWPDYHFYDRQWDIVYSVVEDDETIVVAGNELGKDFIAGFLAVYFFLTRGVDPRTKIPYPCRIVTTSAKDDHLRVLWGEINRFIMEAKYPLDAKKGGPLIINHQDIHRVYQSGPLKGQKCPKSYLKGMVASAETIAALQGHHVADVGDGVPRTLCIGDEASSIPHAYKTMFNTWAKRKLFIGNAWECNNFFKHAGGNIPRKSGEGFHRRVIHIEATDSPNVQYNQTLVDKGYKPSGKVIIPGVKSWNQYQLDLATMDDIQITVSLRARFYKGKELMMFPDAWLNLAAERAERLRGQPRVAEAMGIDTGEGKSNTTWTIGDYRGVIKQISRKTPKTNEIVWDTIDLIEKYQIMPEKVIFDRGGGGKQIADFLREKGYNVQTVGFNDAVIPDEPAYSVEERRDQREQRRAYFNRRAQLYMDFRNLLDPDRFLLKRDRGADSVDGGDSLFDDALVEPEGFAIPAECHELFRQLAPIPLRRDAEGVVRMIPKNKKNPNSKELTMVDLLGCSPDEADSCVLMVHGLLQADRLIEAGAI
jgi:hypothetical protein